MIAIDLCFVEMKRRSIEVSRLETIDADETSGKRVLRRIRYDLVISSGTPFGILIFVLRPHLPHLEGVFGVVWRGGL